MGITDKVKEVALSPDGKQLGAGLLDGTIMLWYMDTFEVLQTLRGHNENVISSIAFSPNNRRNRYQLASGSYDRTIVIWDSLCPAGTYINTSESDCQHTKILGHLVTATNYAPQEYTKVKKVGLGIFLTI